MKKRKWRVSEPGHIFQLRKPHLFSTSMEQKSVNHPSKICSNQAAANPKTVRIERPASTPSLQAAHENLYPFLLPGRDYSRLTSPRRNLGPGGLKPFCFKPKHGLPRIQRRIADQRGEPERRLRQTSRKQDKFATQAITILQSRRFENMISLLLRRLGKHHFGSPVPSIGLRSEGNN